MFGLYRLENFVAYQAKGVVRSIQLSIDFICKSFPIDWDNFFYFRIPIVAARYDKHNSERAPRGRKRVIKADIIIFITPLIAMSLGSSGCKIFIKLRLYHELQAFSPSHHDEKWTRSHQQVGELKFII